jgi:hypothetical protein
MKALSFECFATLVLVATACGGSLTDPGAGHRVKVTTAKPQCVCARHVRDASA